ncbi:unnamed protein product, partial [marine sediment metagenome]
MIIGSYAVVVTLDGMPFFRSPSGAGELDEHEKGVEGFGKGDFGEAEFAVGEGDGILGRDDADAFAAVEEFFHDGVSGGGEGARFQRQGNVAAIASEAGGAVAQWHAEKEPGENVGGAAVEPAEQSPVDCFAAGNVPGTVDGAMELGEFAEPGEDGRIVGEVAVHGADVVRAHFEAKGEFRP